MNILPSPTLCGELLEGVGNSKASFLVSPSVADFLHGLPDVEFPLHAALYYAANGLGVFPIYEPLKDGGCSCEREDCADAGKHPRVSGGVHAATTDPELIRERWKKWPSANVAIACGSVSGVVVVDVDPDRGGLDALKALEEEIGPIPRNAVVRTGREGGFHIYLGHPGGSVKSRNDVLAGIDIKADGGYVVAPPSLHESGRRYEWVRL